MFTDCWFCVCTDNKKFALHFDPLHPIIVTSDKSPAWSIKWFVSIIKSSSPCFRICRWIEFREVYLVLVHFWKESVYNPVDIDLCVVWSYGDLGVVYKLSNWTFFLLIYFLDWSIVKIQNLWVSCCGFELKIWKGAIICSVHKWFWWGTFDVFPLFLFMLNFFQVSGFLILFHYVVRINRIHSLLQGLYFEYLLNNMLNIICVQRCIASVLRLDMEFFEGIY